jgi:hypothetical protein
MGTQNAMGTAKKKRVEDKNSAVAAKASAMDAKTSAEQADPRTNPKGHPLAIDRGAVSASPEAPAFVARPEGAPPYYGFQVLEDSDVDGFRFGKITDFDQEPVMEGEAFLVAPDDARAGLIWHIDDEVSVTQFSPPETDGWGVWEVSFPNPMTNHENVRQNLELIVPLLRERWQAWCESRSGG